MLTKKEVEHIAALARLGLSDNEKEKLAKDLSSVFGYVDKLSEVNTDVVSLRDISRREKKVTPMSGGTSRFNITRQDNPVSDIADDEMKGQILKAAPDRDNGYFKVPSVLD